VETRIYKSNSNYKLTALWSANLKGFRSSWFLARQLAVRDLNAQYRQSVLGYFWALSPVIISSAVWLMLYGSGVVQQNSMHIPYPVYVIVGTSIWSLFTDCLGMNIASINANKSIISKINFDKEALISLSAIKLFFNFILKMLPIVVVLIVYGIVPSLSVLFFLPLLLVSLLLFFSAGILLTPFGSLYSDITRIVPVFMQFLMYLSPVVYMRPEKGLVAAIMKWNPLTYILEDLRNTLTGFPVQHWGVHLGIFSCAAVLFFGSLIVYRISMPIITERMST
jgi:lipopolysaccharide transport system permease protein